MKSFPRWFLLGRNVFEKTKKIAPLCSVLLKTWVGKNPAGYDGTKTRNFKKSSTVFP